VCSAIVAEAATLPVSPHAVFVFENRLTVKSFLNKTKRGNSPHVLRARQCAVQSTFVEGRDQGRRQKLCSGLDRTGLGSSEIFSNFNFLSFLNAAQMDGEVRIWGRCFDSNWGQTDGGSM